MQKKIIALAVAGLMSGAVMAQSNVTVSGIVDIGWSRYSSSDTDTLKSRSGIDSGMQSGSRLTFAGIEDIGGGNKIGFHLENSIGPDTGAGPTMVRQSFLYATGNWGTVAAGRQYTPQFNMMAAIDPFAVGTNGDLLYGRGVYVMGSSAIPTTIRLDNLFAYVSPSFGGFQVTAGYTADGIGDEEVTNNANSSTNAKIWAINPVYKNGPIYVGLNYHQVKIDGFAPAAAMSGSTGVITVTPRANNVDFKNKVWDLGGTYDFGVVKLAGVYGKASENVLDTNVKQWMLGLTAPVGNGAVMVSYANFKESEFDLKANKWALGYQYNLSKRTNLYAVYSKISTNDNAEGMFSTYKGTEFTNFGSSLVATAVDDYTTGINIGLRHKF